MPNQNNKNNKKYTIVHIALIIVAFIGLMFGYIWIPLIAILVELVFWIGTAAFIADEIDKYKKD